MKTESGEQIAVVANQIVQARHRLTPLQQKVIAWGIAQIARDDTEFMMHRLSAVQFAQLVGVDERSGSVYRNMETVTTSLLKTILEIRETEGARHRTKFQWLAECRYHDGEGVAEIRFHPKLKPYLLELRSRFTQLRLEKFFKFRSSYTIRFYELITMNKGLDRKTWIMQMGELREWLGLEPESYSFFGLLRANVIDVAQRELDAKSDWSFSFTTLKEGRKIVGVKFNLRPARSPKADPRQDRWKKASPELRTAVLEAARGRPRWDNQTDAAILADSGFWEYLDALFDEVEAGQKALPL